MEIIESPIPLFNYEVQLSSKKLSIVIFFKMFFYLICSCALHKMKSTCFMLNLRNYWNSGWRALRTSHMISHTVFWKYFSNMCLVGLEFDKTSLFSKCFLCYFETILCRCHVSLCACMLICRSLNQEWRIYKLSIKILVHDFEKMVIPDVYVEKMSYFGDILNL